jgi:NADPH:quinone reductase
MRVVECRQFGPVDDLAVIDRPSPELADDQVRIDVAACGVNYVDGLFVRGAYQIKPPLPFVPGMEVVGTIVEIGRDVAGVGPDPSLGNSLALGDRVLANVGLGGYASEAVATANQVVVLPDTLTDGQAATFMQSYLTAWFALVERGGVAAGDTLAVLGAGSGVGLAAVDLASALDVAVVAVASTADKRDLATTRGAVETVDSGALSVDDVKSAVRDFGARHGSAPGGVDHLYDPVGGPLGEACLRALGENGQYLVIGFVAGIPKLPANQVLLRNRRIVGVDWGAWAGRHPVENRAMLDGVLAMIATGDLTPPEPVTYPLADAAAALTDLAERRVAGKVALVP